MLINLLCFDVADGDDFGRVIGDETFGGEKPAGNELLDDHRATVNGKCLEQSGFSIYLFSNDTHALAGPCARWLHNTGYADLTDLILSLLNIGCDFKIRLRKLGGPPSPAHFSFIGCGKCYVEPKARKVQTLTRLGRSEDPRFSQGNDHVDMLGLRHGNDCVGIGYAANHEYVRMHSSRCSRVSVERDNFVTFRFKADYLPVEWLSGGKKENPRHCRHLAAA